jgi:hypothetical protein
MPTDQLEALPALDAECREVGAVNCHEKLVQGKTSTPDRTYRLLPAYTRRGATAILPASSIHLRNPARGSSVMV